MPRRIHRAAGVFQRNGKSREDCSTDHASENLTSTVNLKNDSLQREIISLASRVIEARQTGIIVEYKIVPTHRCNVQQHPRSGILQASANAAKR